jgi:hypothetical protein
MNLQTLDYGAGGIGAASGGVATDGIGGYTRIVFHMA